MSFLATFLRGFTPLSAEALLSKAASHTLAEFPSAAALELWRVVTDSSAIGGSSRASLDVVCERGISFARFSGTLSKEVKGHQKRVRSGFAALQGSLLDPPVCLGEYDHLSIKFRTDGRPYCINLRVDSFGADDLYQGALLSKGDAEEWITLKLPLRDLALTGRGRLRERQRALDGDFDLQSIGILVADEVDGPFQLDIASVSLHPYETLTHSSETSQ